MVYLRKPRGQNSTPVSSFCVQLVKVESVETRKKHRMSNVDYLFRLREVVSLQITNFIESTLQDVFVYKVGAFTYFFCMSKDMFSQVDVITKIFNSVILKYF